MWRCAAAVAGRTRSVLAPRRGVPRLSGRAGCRGRRPQLQQRRRLARRSREATPAARELRLQRRPRFPHAASAASAGQRAQVHDVDDDNGEHVDSGARYGAAAPRPLLTVFAVHQEKVQRRLLYADKEGEMVPGTDDSDAEEPVRVSASDAVAPRAHPLCSGGRFCRPARLEQAGGLPHFEHRRTARKRLGASPVERLAHATPALTRGQRHRRLLTSWRLCCAWLPPA